MRARRWRRRLAERGTQRTLLEGVARVFGLDAPPERIEVYDNSHIQGTAPIGAMIVAGPEGFIKNAYRKFNIKTEGAAGDDFAMMREVLTPPLRPRAQGESRARRGALARPGADRRRPGPARSGAPGADRARPRGHRHGRHRQGPRPQRRPRALLHARQAALLARAARSRCSTSCSACATRRIASRSALTARAARPTSRARPSTRCRASAPAASARCCNHFGSARAVARGDAGGHQVGAGHLRRARPENP